MIWTLALFMIASVLVLFAFAIWRVVRPEMVKIGQRRVEVKIKGTGSPAVVYESGAGFIQLLWWSFGSRQNWRFLQNRVAKETATLTYERAGLGRSDPGPEPRSAEQIAGELHALLEAKAIAPPYILVGHSLGGMYIRVFARRYPQEIAGLVFVDPATEEFYDRIRTVMSARWSRLETDLQKMGAPPGEIGQTRALSESIDQARQSWPLPAAPTVVLTSCKPLSAPPFETSEDMKAWSDSHRQLAENIPASKHILIEDVDHRSILKAPAVKEQILELLEKVRASRAGVSPCPGNRGASIL